MTSQAITDRGEHPVDVVVRLLGQTTERTMYPVGEVVDGLLDIQQALTRWSAGTETPA